MINLVRLGQGEVGREEAETAGDEVVIGGHGRRMGGVVAVGQRDQRRGIDERDVWRGRITRFDEQLDASSLTVDRLRSNELQIAALPRGDVSAAAAADGDDVAERDQARSMPVRRKSEPSGRCAGRPRRRRDGRTTARRVGAQGATPRAGSGGPAPSSVAAACRLGDGQRAPTLRDLSSASAVQAQM